MVDKNLFKTIKERGLMYQCTDEEALKKLALFFDALDEDDDVQNVYNNLENTEDLPEL